jgi:hypothetical protein
MISEDDKRHAAKALDILAMAKERNLVGVVSGSLPDSEESYAFATDSASLAGYYSGGDGEE